MKFNRFCFKHLKTYPSYESCPECAKQRVVSGISSTPPFVEIVTDGWVMFNVKTLEIWGSTFSKEMNVCFSIAKEAWALDCETALDHHHWMPIEAKSTITVQVGNIK